MFFFFLHTCMYLILAKILHACMTYMPHQMVRSSTYTSFGEHPSRILNLTTYNHGYNANTLNTMVRIQRVFLYIRVSIRKVKHSQLTKIKHNGLYAIFKICNLYTKS